jgi:hypothetical protein
MHAFAVAFNLSQESEQRLEGGLRGLGEELKLDPATAWSCRSRSGVMFASGLHHAPEAARPRRYLALTDRTATFFDGLPVHSSAGLDALDAGVLAERWEELPATLEGQFNAVRLDLEADNAEVLMDPLGMLRIYVARRGRETVAANSVRVLAGTLGCREPDRLGVASMVALGWAVEDRTLLGEVDTLAGGAVHRLSGEDIRTRTHFDPQGLVAGRAKPVAPEQFTESMSRLTGEAVAGIEPIRCALTAGRDTRVLLALLQSAGRERDASFYTGGAPGSHDVELGSELARRLTLRHEVDSPDMGATDWDAAADRFIAQTDGLASLLQLPDYMELKAPPRRLGVTMWGVGGEIGRAGTGPINHVTPNLPVVSSLPEFQRRLMVNKMEHGSGLLTAEGHGLVRSYLERFVATRRAEGWPTREVYEAFYAFERVGCGGASGPRRAAGTGDVFSPFCSRQFIEYSFSLSAGERYLEAPHHRLLQTLAPELLEYRFEVPFHPQRRWAVAPMAVSELIRAVRAHRRPAPPTAGPSEPPFLTQWVESQLAKMKRLAESADPSLWQLISRPRLTELLAAGPEARRAHTEPLLRVATVLWFLEG